MPVEGGYVELVSVNSGLCLTVAGNSMSDGARLIQYWCDGRQSQQWRFRDAGGIYSNIKNRNSSK